MELLFGVLISSKGIEDLQRMNPFLDEDRIRVVFDIIVLTMLRANRLGHANRCIAMGINLQNLLAKASDNIC